MACTINKGKHVCWYLMLATVVVLIWVLLSRNIMVKTIVALQHAPRDAQLKRKWRPNSYLTERINGSDEERVVFLPILEELATGEKFEAKIPEINKNAKSLPETAGLLKWADSLEELTFKEYQIAASAKLLELLTEHGENWVHSMLEAAEKDPATRETAQDLHLISATA